MTPSGMANVLCLVSQKVCQKVWISPVGNQQNGLQRYSSLGGGECRKQVDGFQLSPYASYRNPLVGSANVLKLPLDLMTPSGFGRGEVCRADGDYNFFQGSSTRSDEKRKC